MHNADLVRLVLRSFDKHNYDDWCDKLLSTLSEISIINFNIFYGHPTSLVIIVGLSAECDWRQST